MQFYIILLRYNKVINVRSFDREDIRDFSAENLKAQLREWSDYDEVQVLNEINHILTD